MTLTLWLPVNGDEVDWGRLDPYDERILTKDEPTSQLANGWHWEKFIIQRAS